MTDEQIINEFTKDKAKSLMWLVNQFPFTKNPTDDGDRLCNCINLYCRLGAEEIHKLQEENEKLKCDIELYKQHLHNLARELEEISNE